MHIVMLWILIVPGPRPYIVGKYPSLAACTQMKYDMSGTTSSKKSGMVCKPRPTQVRDSTPLQESDYE